MDTEVTPLRAKAPGKLLLFGEYVVLEGAPALATAVPQAAHALFVPHGAPTDPFAFEASNLGARFVTTLATPDEQGDALEKAPGTVQLLVRAAAAAMELSGRSLSSGTLSVDTREFYHQGSKLGLGSSAAALVSAMQALMRAPSMPAEVRARALSFDTLSRLHRAWQNGRGSGIDIATSLHGGTLRFQLPHLPGSETTTDVVMPLEARHGPPWVAIAVGHDMSTRVALTQFAALKERTPDVYWRHMEDLAHVSRAAVEFWPLRQHIAFLPLVKKACEVLDSLGNAMDIDIVSPPHRELVRIATECGGAYKPSGAGGGDVGVAFFAHPRARKAFLKRIHKTSYRVIAASP